MAEVSGAGLARLASDPLVELDPPGAITGSDGSQSHVETASGIVSSRREGTKTEAVRVTPNRRVAPALSYRRPVIVSVLCAQLGSYRLKTRKNETEGGDLENKAVKAELAATRYKVSRIGGC